MKIFSAEQIRQWDAATIAEQQITDVMLMERASVAFTNTLLQRITPDGPIMILCGSGNNGGDGLCIARLLQNKGYASTVYITGDLEQASEAVHINYTRLKNLGHDIRLLEPDDVLPETHYHYIIDALFGSGLNRPITGWHASLIEQINAMDALRIAVDIPSGLFADKPSTGAIVEADITLTFESPKLAFFFPENAGYVGEWEVVPIGLSANWAQHAQSAYTYLSAEYFIDTFKPRAHFSHKGTYGHALIVAGNTATPGAAALSAFAALKTGAGLVTLCNNTVTPEHPEIMHELTANLEKALSSGKFQSVAIGPGMGTDAGALQALTTTLTNARTPIVIDADALNILSAHTHLIAHIPAGSILTPHPKEFARLFGKPDNWLSLLHDLQSQAKNLQCFIMYKQANTIIASPDGRIYFNSSGNPGMATAGSGDVLTGVITGLLAQGYTSELASLAGVYLHGVAGDFAMMDTDGRNIVAGDIISHIQEAFSIL